MAIKSSSVRKKSRMSAWLRFTYSTKKATEHLRWWSLLAMVAAAAMAAASVMAAADATRTSAVEAAITDVVATVAEAAVTAAVASAFSSVAAAAEAAVEATGAGSVVGWFGATDVTCHIMWLPLIIFLTSAKDASRGRG